MDTGRTARGAVTFEDITTGLVWPRLLRAAPLALRPSRLLLALVTVAAVMVAGGIFDTIRGRPVGASGFAAEAPTPERIQQILRAAATDQSIVLPEDAQALGAKSTLTPSDVRAAVARKWRSVWDSLDPERRASADFLARARAPYQSAAGALREAQPRGVFEAAAADLASSFIALSRAVVTADVPGVGAAAGAWWTQSAGPMFRRFPVSAVVLGVLVALILSLGGGALARSAACDVAGWPVPGPGDALVFAARRRRDFTWSLLGPGAVVVALAILLAFAGALLLRAPVVNVVGALLYGLALALGAAAIFIVAAFLLGGALLAPAIAVECTDWMDAVQRAYAYVTGKTARLLAYTALWLVECCVVYAALGLFLVTALNWTAATTNAWTGQSPGAVAGGIDLWLFRAQEDAWALHGSRAVAAGVIGLWERLALGILPAFVVSYLFSGGAMLYLCVRRINDQQDIADVSMDDEQAARSSPFVPETTAAAGAPDAGEDADDE